MMKNSWQIALGIVLVAAGANAQFLDTGTRSVHVDYVYDDDVWQDDGNGVEIAFGSALYDLDDMAVFFKHVENSDVEMQALGIKVEENWPIAGLAGLAPWAGVGTGYGWLDISGEGVDAVDIDQGGWFARVEGGLKLLLTDAFAFSAGARLNFATHEIYADEDELEDTNWDFTFGFRYYY